MGLLNFEHGKVAHRADIALFGIAVAVLAGSAWVAKPDGRGFAACGWALSGLAAWTLVEYLLHRFVLHRLPPFKRLHATHHQHPTALIGSPTLMTTALFGLLVFAPSHAAFGLWRACALTLGMVGGYLAFTIVHHGVHHWRGSARWLQRRRRWHGLHHRSPAQPACFGVTSGFWDHVFGTDGARPVTRAPSIQEHQMPMILRRFDFFDGQRNGTLATCTPDDVDAPTAQALEQAGAYGNILLSPTACQIGDRAGDASAVCRDVHEPVHVSLAVRFVEEGRACNVLEGWSVRQRTRAKEPLLSVGVGCHTVHPTGLE